MAKIVVLLRRSLKGPSVSFSDHNSKELCLKFQDFSGMFHFLPRQTQETVATGGPAVPKVPLMSPTITCQQYQVTIIFIQQSVLH